MVQLGLTLSSVFPYVYIGDTSVVSGAKAAVGRCETASNLSAAPSQELTFSRVEGNYYNGAYFYFLDDGPMISGNTYRICQGLLYAKSDTGESCTYVDSGRTLERYILNIIANSEMIDSILWQPLTYYVPESLFVATRSVARLPSVHHPGYAAAEGSVHSLFDLSGRRVRCIVDVSRLSAATLPAGAYLFRRTSSNVKKTATLGDSRRSFR